ncbi:SDR family oxidoreductase [Komagataeibacter oboediens]|uniref:SDR family oxidoreductase n=1 Tax=Komagataeibacter oboediens TaxID=65958 RepID=UPI0020C3930A|nr:SDR family oxidoreductase [Komagataeibacter oboediens]
MSGNTIVITGGGSGIGEALAHRFHDLGNTVIIAGRRIEALEEAIVGRPRMHALTVDIESTKSILIFARRLIAEFPTVNVLINNAGIMRMEKISCARDLADAEATVITNLLGPIRLTNALIDHLTEQPNSAIVNVSSGLGFVPLVGAPTYSATKAAIHSYTVTMREALRGKVEVMELVPPAVQTGLTPGQATRPGYLPLGDFIDEVMSLFQQQPALEEILVERVNFQRKAEAENRFANTLKMLNDAARKAQESLS